MAHISWPIQPRPGTSRCWARSEANRGWARTAWCPGTQWCPRPDGPWGCRSARSCGCAARTGSADARCSGPRRWEPCCWSHRWCRWLQTTISVSSIVGRRCLPDQATIALNTSYFKTSRPWRTSGWAMILLSCRCKTFTPYEGEREKNVRNFELNRARALHKEEALYSSSSSSSSSSSNSSSSRRGSSSSGSFSRSSGLIACLTTQPALNTWRLCNVKGKDELCFFIAPLSDVYTIQRQGQGWAMLFYRAAADVYTIQRKGEGGGGGGKKKNVRGNSELNRIRVFNKEEA